MDASIKTILFLGPTGSGKGVQSKLLTEKLGYEVYSTGGRYRELRIGESDLAKRIREEYDLGLLMPPWFSTFLFEEATLYRPLSKGIIHESTAKTLPEAQQFDEVMAWLRRPYVVFYLQITEEESMKRQMIRKEAGHRPDSDTEEKIRTRFKEYNEKTAPAADFFRSKGKMIELDGMRSVEEIHADVLKHLGL
jgi:adenylate kinase